MKGWLDTYYQEGKDFKPKTISQFGSTLSPINPLMSKGSQGDRTIDLIDPRKVRATTGKPIVANRDLVSGKYDGVPMEEIIKRTKKRGLKEEDAWNLMSIGLQETGLGKIGDEWNIGHVTGWTSENTYDNMIDAYVEKMAIADRLKYTDPALRLQLYNGTGMITPKSDFEYHGFKMDSIYGVPIPKGGINMKKNPLYGKQILDLRDNVLKKNLEVQKMMNQYYEHGGTIAQDGKLIPTDTKRNIHTNQPVISPREEWEKQQIQKSELAEWLKKQNRYQQEHSDIYTDPQTGKQVVQNIGIEPTASPVDAAALGVGALYSGGIGLLGSMAEFANPLPINPFKIGKSLKNFKSEIDWTKWNKEIPENTKLLKEYHNIEATTKANNTWMKNSDGSIFQGSPEEFIQQQSSNFKKAFPNGFDVTYRGARRHHPELDYNPIFTADKNSALEYTTAHGDYWRPSHLDKAVTDIKDKTSGGLHKLYYNDKLPTLRINAKNRDWTELNVPEINKERLIATDDVSNYISGKQQLHLADRNEPLMNAVIDNVYDATTFPGTVRILPHSEGSYLKSAIGNNGMFDMTNPNIYKSLLPIGIGTGAYQANKSSYASGGTIKQDNEGYRNPENWGKPVQINSSHITMNDDRIPYSAIRATDETGYTQIIPKGYDAIFPGKRVTEVPIAQKGATINWADKY